MDSKKLQILLTAKDNASGKLDKFGVGIGGLAKKAGKAAIAISAIGVAAGVAFGKKSIDAAIDLSESINAVEKTFGKASEEIFKFGETAAEQAGLSKAAFNSATVPIGAMLQNMGLDARDAADETINLGKRAADLSSVFNSDLSESLVAIQSGLRGESEPLKRFGVDLSQTTVKAYALAKGLIKQGEEMDNTTLATARLGSFMEQTNKFQGDFVDTSDQAANRQRILQARMENLSSVIGVQLLPAWEKLLEAGEWFANNIMPKIVDWIQSAKDKFEEWKPTLQRTRDDILEIATRVGDFLIPKLEALINTIKEDLMPALNELNNSGLGRLISLMGTSVVFVIGLVIDQLNFSITVISKVIGWLGKLVDGIDYVVVGYAKFSNAVYQKIKPAIDAVIGWISRVLKWMWRINTTMVRVMADMYGIIVKPFKSAFGWIGDKIGWLLERMGLLNRSAEKSLEKTRKATQEHNASVNGGAVSFGDGFAHGGMPQQNRVATVGERGAELFIPEQKGRIVKNMDAKRMMGSEISIVVNNPVFENPQSADAWWKRLDRDGKLTAMGMSGVNI